MEALSARPRFHLTSNPTGTGNHRSWANLQARRCLETPPVRPKTASLPGRGSNQAWVPAPRRASAASATGSLAAPPRTRASQGFGGPASPQVPVRALSRTRWNSRPPTSESCQGSPVPTRTAAPLTRAWPLCASPEPATPPTAPRPTSPPSGPENPRPA